MHSLNRPLLLLALLLPLMAGCNPLAIPDNESPTITLLEPTERSFLLGDEVKMQAEASDPDGSISHVTFYIDDVEVGMDAKVPYLYTFTPTVAKRYVLVAKAYDDQGADSASSSVTVQVSAAADLYTLTVNVSGAGTVSSAPAGIACPGTCQASFASGQTVTLSAVAAEGSSLARWGGACSGTETTCTLTPDDPSSVQVSVNFEVIAPSPDSVKIVAAGDISCGDYSPRGTEFCRSQQTASLVSSIDPDLVLLLGDTQYDPSTYQDFLD